MRTTLQDQITVAAEQRQQAHKQDHFEWMLAHERLITHAVTLTFDPKKIDGYTAAFNRSLTRNHPEMIERYKDSVKLFANILDRSLFGNMSQRKGSPLLFVPVIEGLNNGQVPHFHCSVGIPENRFDEAIAKQQKIEDAKADVTLEVELAAATSPLATVHIEGVTGTFALLLVKPSLNGSAAVVGALSELPESMVTALITRMAKVRVTKQQQAELTNTADKDILAAALNASNDEQILKAA